MRRARDVDVDGGGDESLGAGSLANCCEVREEDGMWL